VLAFPFERTRASLERMSKSEDPHPSHGWKLRYSNPATRRDPFPTMAVFMQWLPKGFAGRNFRSTDGAVHCVVEGRGDVRIGAVADAQPEISLAQFLRPEQIADADVDGRVDVLQQLRGVAIAQRLVPRLYEGHALRVR